jgi:D-alanyl-lipoteichoic acid acyltransferase DltB (MBOAT superfamily)
MLFNSIDFAIFLPVVLIAYWGFLNKNLKLQNFLILVSSYIFYAWWDWRFLFLIILSTVVDFIVAKFVYKSNDEFSRKFFLLVSFVFNIGLLFYFKYYNFFLDSFLTAFSFFGRKLDISSLSIVLPVGISFYTFQTLSYTIDVYRKKLTPSKDFIAFSAFVSFFPQLVAGPIERATNLLPQFVKTRSFNYSKAIDGLRQILWGLFKKVVIADNCAEYVNQIFNNSDEYSGSVLFLGAFFFAFQIYGDFSGYSDIAIGTARLFGFHLMMNFNFPYFSRDISEFWRRWHISLTTWFRDYIYIPLGGSRGGLCLRIRNVLIIFIISGIWHGANFTFIFWGIVHAIFFIPLLVFNKNRKYVNTVVGGNGNPIKLSDILSILITFTLVVLAWIAFRADNIGHAFSIYSKIFSFSFFSIPRGGLGLGVVFVMFLVIVFLIVEWFGRFYQFGIQNFGKNWPKIYRWIFYYVLILSILFFGGNKQEFIYFQF